MLNFERKVLVNDCIFDEIYIYDLLDCIYIIYGRYVILCMIMLLFVLDLLCFFFKLFIILYLFKLKEVKNEVILLFFSFFFNVDFFCLGKYINIFLYIVVKK